VTNRAASQLTRKFASGVRASPTTSAPSRYSRAWDRSSRCRHGAEEASERPDFVDVAPGTRVTTGRSPVLVTPVCPHLPTRPEAASGAPRASRDQRSSRARALPRRCERPVPAYHAEDRHSNRIVPRAAPVGRDAGVATRRRGASGHEAERSGGARGAGVRSSRPLLRASAPLPCYRQPLRTPLRTRGLLSARARPPTWLANGLDPKGQARVAAVELAKALAAATPRGTSKRPSLLLAAVVDEASTTRYSRSLSARRARAPYTRRLSSRAGARSAGESPSTASPCDRFAIVRSPRTGDLGKTGRKRPRGLAAATLAEKEPRCRA
jgi:hypothetical protein